MERKAVSGITLTLLLTIMLTLAFNIQPAKSEPTTWTVDDDGPADFSKIQDAISAASGGDTIYVYNGTYHGLVSVSKSLTIIGESKSNTVIDGSGFLKAVIAVWADNVTITRIAVQNGPLGWYYSQGSCIYIHNGVESSNISENMLSNSRYGIGAWNSIDGTFRGNIISIVERGISFDGGKSNTISGNLILNTTIVDENYSWGIDLWDSDNNTISNNTISYSEKGIQLYHSKNNKVIGNTISNSTWGGPYWGGGIYLDSYSSNNKVIDNTISNTTEAGICILTSSNNNVIVSNIISKTELVGIHLQETCSNNTIIGNTILSTQLGINFHSNSDHNIVCHNNFIDNISQAVVYNSYNNVWDDGYPSGGNYWSDYTGVDEKNGPNQDQPESDGIGDTPYIIDGNNQDNYPLMKPWTPAPPTVVATADIVPNTLNLKSEGKWVTAYIELPEGYNLSDIDLYSVRLNDTFPVSLLPNPPVPVPTEIGDYDNDGVPDLMVKFNRTELTAHIYHDLGIRYGNVTLTVAGELADGTVFEGGDVVRVIFAGDVDNDGFVNVFDLLEVRDVLGTAEGDFGYDPGADLNLDGFINIHDLLVARLNLGAAVP